MGMPDQQQAEALVTRVGETLDEWDDATYAVIVEYQGDKGCHRMRGKEIAKIAMARTILERVLYDYHQTCGGCDLGRTLERARDVLCEIVGEKGQLM